MIFPLALAGVLFPWPFAKPHDSALPRVLCSVALLVISIAILLSLSRGVWMAIPVATAVFWGMVAPTFGETMSSMQPVSERRRAHQHQAQEDRKRTAWSIKRLFAHRWFVFGISMTVFVAVVLWLAGPSVRSQTDQRIGVTLASGMSLGFRYTLAEGTLNIIRAFPLFGVGLGNWPEIFPRFQSPPSFPLYANHAHNDYLELAADIGLIGMAGFIWLAARLIAIFRSAAKSIEPVWWPWFAALIAALVFLASNELLDFNLHR